MRVNHERRIRPFPYGSTEALGPLKRVVRWKINHVMTYAMRVIPFYGSSLSYHGVSVRKPLCKFLGKFILCDTASSIIFA